MARILQVALVVLGMTCGDVCAAGKPNIVLINADDLGYGDVGCYGATKLQTPNIDRLAKEGRRFTDAHTASAVCSPSRYGLMTGQFPLRRNFWGPLPFTNELTIDVAQPTLAGVLRSAGYETAIIGKWHLGFGKGQTDWNKPLKPGPLEVGFDYYFGMPTVNSGPPFVYVENHHVVDYDPADPFVMGETSVTQEFPEKDGYERIGGATKAHERYRDEFVGTTFAEKAVAWIKDRDPQDGRRPFFLYLATTNIHHPFTPHPRFRGTSQCGLYGDFVHELDWIVGEVLHALDETALADDTLVVFTSDNGGMLNNTGQTAWKAGHRLNGKLLGFKFGAWEGGHRVPFIVRWPGKVPAGTESDALVSQIDLLPTLAAASGAEIPDDAVIDGVDQLPELTGRAKQPARDMLIISPNSPMHLTVRKGKWAYIPAHDEGGFQGKKIGDHLLGGAAAQQLTHLVNSDVVDGKIRDDAPPAQLYDLRADPYQTRNVHDERPEIVAELAQQLKAWRNEIPTSARLGWINLNQSSGGRNADGTSTTGAAPRTPAGVSERSASFDFESGTLDPWKVVDGDFGRPVGNRSEFFHNGREYNKQGEFYLTTLEPSADAQKGLDKQTGVIVSPLFVPEAGTMTFRIGGGRGQSTYAALCTADGEEVEFARGVNDQTMHKAAWDLTPYAGRKMFVRIVDRSTTGWGHVTVDDFQFDAEVLKEYPEPTPRAETKPTETSSAPTDGPPTRSPNFVVIFTDDQGYGDLSCFGGKHVSTPRIDRMAKEGSRLTSFYVAAPVCTPSRAALMTGCYPKRIDMATGSDFVVLLAGDPKGLNPGEITVAEVLKEAGYRTGIFGKWHLGDQPEFLPTKQGFDEYFGIPFSHDIHPFHPRQSHFMFPPLALLQNETVVEMDPNADFLTKRITEHAVSFIERNKDDPFFLYVPHPIPHKPLHVSPPFMNGVALEIRGQTEERSRLH